MAPSKPGRTSVQAEESHLWSYIIPSRLLHKLSFALLSNNFKKCNSDSSLSIKIDNEKTTIVLIYVDDIIVTGSDMYHIDQVRSFLKSSFEVKDLGPLEYFLGIKLAYSHKGLVLSQRKVHSQTLAGNK